jgi:hypothetical protein
MKNRTLMAILSSGLLLLGSTPPAPAATETHPQKTHHAQSHPSHANQQSTGRRGSAARHVGVGAAGGAGFGALAGGRRGALIGGAVGAGGGAAFHRSRRSRR